MIVRTYWERGGKECKALINIKYTSLKEAKAALTKLAEDCGQHEHDFLIQEFELEDKE